MWRENNPAPLAGPVSARLSQSGENDVKASASSTSAEAFARSCPAASSARDNLPRRRADAKTRPDDHGGITAVGHQLAPLRRVIRLPQHDRGQGGGVDRQSVFRAGDGDQPRARARPARAASRAAPVRVAGPEATTRWPRPYLWPSSRGQGMSSRQSFWRVEKGPGLDFGKRFLADADLGQARPRRRRAAPAAAHARVSAGKRSRSPAPARNPSRSRHWRRRGPRARPPPAPPRRWR